MLSSFSSERLNRTVAGVAWSAFDVGARSRSASDGLRPKKMGNIGYVSTRSPAPLIEATLLEIGNGEYSVIELDYWASNARPTKTSPPPPINGLDVVGSLDNEFRTAAHLVINAPEVFADNSERYQLHTTEKRHEDDQGR